MTDALTDALIDALTDLMTDAPTDALTDALTDLMTNALIDLMTDALIDAPTDAKRVSSRLRRKQNLFWIGMWQTAAGAPLTWSDGSRRSYHRFRGSPPGNDGSKCALLYNSHGTAATWCSDMCTASYVTVCKRRAGKRCTTTCRLLHRCYRRRHVLRCEQNATVCIMCGPLPVICTTPVCPS